MNNQKEIDLFVDHCFKGETDKVLDALDNGMNPDAKNSNGQTPLISAINGERAEVVGCLITWQADLNLDNWTPLHQLFDLAIDGMIQNNDSEVSPSLLKILKELLEFGADLNKINKEGKTPLDSINTYSTNEESFNRLKDCFRNVISDIDERIKFH